jgi:hypothetical protein
LNDRLDAARDVMGSFPSEVRETIPAQIAAFLVDAGTAKDGGMAACPPVIDLKATAGDVFPRMLAQGYALAGMPEDAIRCLRVAIDRGFINYPFLARHDPFFDSIARCRHSSGCWSSSAIDGTSSRSERGYDQLMALLAVAAAPR